MYNKEIKEAFQELQTGPRGLLSVEARDRLTTFGSNELKDDGKINPLIIFLNQFNNPVIFILIAAGLISFFILHEIVDAIVIAVIVIINGILGFIQEYKAEKAIEALKKLTSLRAKVLRSNKEVEIDAKDVVPGDIILLQTGDKIPADARLINVANLETQEASLTGESTPVKKKTDVLPNKCPVADQSNMVFSSTIVTKGRGRAVVVHTGMKTEIGKIASMIQKEKPTPTPLQLKLKQLGRYMSAGVVLISLIVFGIGVLAGNEMGEMFLAAISLAVAAIPEGLPAVVTISLALGVQRMVKRHSLVRRLPSVETLGSTDVICTDKTGTLTKNEMTVTHLYVNEKVIEIIGKGYEKKGDFLLNKKPINSSKFSQLLMIGALCNDAKVEDKVVGDPTEAAMIVAAAKAGLDKESLEKKYPRRDELPFDPERKSMSTYHVINGKKTVLTKGAPDIILNYCDRILINGKVFRMTATHRKKILKQNELFASRALRVLGCASKESGELTETKLIFVGLQAMIDPARDEVKEAVKECEAAGIKAVIITGDHEITAKAVAKEIGIEGKSITGAQLEKLSDKEFETIVDDLVLYARVNPSHKMKIIAALKKKGHIVAMTGDGVNDAPALKKADIGVAMGVTGTDVAKEASDMILTDDNFASIVGAVKEGRGTYGNIRKYLGFLISGNIGEVMIIFLAILFGWNLPMTATQILLINLVTDGLPAVALSADPFEPHAMKRKPRKLKEPIFKGLQAFVIYYPAVMIATVLGIFLWFTKNNLVAAQTAVFLSVGMFELYQAFACRSTIYPSYKVGLFKNKFLILAVLSSLLIMIATIYLPVLNSKLDMAPLGVAQFVTIALLSSIGAIVIEISKIIKNRKSNFESTN